MTASVLVVDDDVALARNIASLLSPIGVRAEIATSVHAALEAARDTSFDLAILDIVLPDGNGLALASRLRDQLPDAEVVFVSGQATLDHAAEAVGERASALLLKPFAPARLLGTVQRALDRKRSASRAFATKVRANQHRVLARLSDGLAHELRNPLNGALLQLEVAVRQLRRDADAPNEAALRHLADARAELRRMAQTLTEFECCVRPAPPLRERVAARDIVERALGGVQALAAVGHVGIVRDVEPGLVIDADPVSLAGALANLAENAIEAMPSGGTLTVQARSLGGRVVIEIEDEGVGIPDAAAVFDPYFSTKPMGTGLGLSVVERVVADHDGTVEVTSRPGSTRFTISLPASGERA